MKSKIILFVLVVVGSFSISRFLVSHRVHQRQAYSSLINVAGRQRMLSQLLRIESKNLADELVSNKIDPTTVLNLKTALKELKNGDSILRNSNIEGTDYQLILHNVHVPFATLVSASRSLLGPNLSIEKIDSTEAIVQKASNEFLLQMETAVDKIVKESDKSLRNLNDIELILSVVTVLTVLGGFAIIIFPLIRDLNRSNEELVQRNHDLAASDDEVRTQLEQIINLNERLEKAIINDQLFIEQAPGAIAMFDNEMRYMVASNKWYDDYGLSGKEIIGKSHYEIFPEIGDDWRTIHNECLLGATNRASEMPFERGDGSVQWLTWDVRPWKKSDGSIGGIIMYTSDVTEFKSLKDEQARLEEVLTTTSEVAKIGAWKINLLKNYALWSDTTRTILEVDSTYDPTADSIIDFFEPGDHRNLLKKSLEKAIDQGKEFDIEAEVVTSSDKKKWVRMIGQSELKNGKCIRVFGIIQDIDEFKQQQQKTEFLLTKVSKQNLQLSNFAHITSHNLRSPVGNLGALLSFYKNSQDEKDKEMLMSKFEIVIGHLSSTLDTLVETLKIREGNDRTFQEITFQDVLNKTSEILGAQIMETQAIVSSQFSNAPVLNYNQDYLESIFLNLMSNAIKYRSQGRTPEIYISSRLIDDNKTELTFSDNGSGIDLAKHGNKVFGLNKTFHRHKDAKGVGLFMTKNQIESLGGTIAITSEVGNGTTFTIIF